MYFTHWKHIHIRRILTWKWLREHGRKVSSIIYLCLMMNTCVNQGVCTWHSSPSVPSQLWMNSGRNTIVDWMDLCSDPAGHVTYMYWKYKVENLPSGLIKYFMHCKVKKVFQIFWKRVLGYLHYFLKLLYIYFFIFPLNTEIENKIQQWKNQIYICLQSLVEDVECLVKGNSCGHCCSNEVFFEGTQQWIDP